MSAALHPADEMAYVRVELDRLTLREIGLRRAFVEDREARVGILHHAVVTRMAGWDVVDVERLPDLCETLRLLESSVLCIDAETTGLHPLDGDRVVSLAILEGRVGNFPRLKHPLIPSRVDFIDGVWIGSQRAWVGALSPEGRACFPEALAVHGLSDERLATRPPFAEYAHELDGIPTGSGYDDEGVRTIVAHNAPFDIGFLDAEFARAGRSVAWGPIIDTRVLSKMLWPDEKASLDALCERLGVDRGDRDERHEFLKDARLVALCLPGLVAEIRRRVA